MARNLQESTQANIAEMSQGGLSPELLAQTSLSWISNRDPRFDPDGGAGRKLRSGPQHSHRFLQAGEPPQRYLEEYLRSRHIHHNRNGDCGADRARLVFYPGSSLGNLPFLLKVETPVEDQRWRRRNPGFGIFSRERI